MKAETYGEALGGMVSYGLLESCPASARMEADGDDERELYFEACESIPPTLGGD